MVEEAPDQEGPDDPDPDADHGPVHQGVPRPQDPGLGAGRRLLVIWTGSDDGYIHMILSRAIDS